MRMIFESCANVASRWESCGDASSDVRKRGGLTTLAPRSSYLLIAIVVERSSWFVDSLWDSSFLLRLL